MGFFWQFEWVIVARFIIDHYYSWALVVLYSLTAKSNFSFLSFNIAITVDLSMRIYLFSPMCNRIGGGAFEIFKVLKIWS